MFYKLGKFFKKVACLCFFIHLKISERKARIAKRNNRDIERILRSYNITKMPTRL